MKRLLSSLASPSTPSGTTFAMSLKSWAYLVGWNWFFGHSANENHLFLSRLSRCREFVNPRLTEVDEFLLTKRLRRDRLLTGPVTGAEVGLGGHDVFRPRG